MRVGVARDGADEEARGRDPRLRIRTRMAKARRTALRQGLGLDDNANVGKNKKTKLGSSIFRSAFLEQQQQQKQGFQYLFCFNFSLEN